MNSVANGKVRRVTPFRRVYVQSAAGDAGGAIGAAFALWHKLGGKRSFVMDHAYWGPHFGQDDIAEVLSEQQDADRRRSAATIEEIAGRGRNSAAAPRRQSPTARSSAGFRGAWNGGRARSATARSCAIPAAPT